MQEFMPHQMQSFWGGLCNWSFDR